MGLFLKRYGSLVKMNETQLNTKKEMNDSMNCCPTIEEMIEPDGGRDMNDMWVELYRNGNNVQRFFEYSCLPYVLDKPCGSNDNQKSYSRCVQMYSYAYAIVKVYFALY